MQGETVIDNWQRTEKLQKLKRGQGRGENSAGRRRAISLKFWFVMAMEDDRTL